MSTIDSMFDIWADRLGVVVREVDFTDGRWGAYHDPSGMIFLQRGLAPIQRRSTLAHELGHAFYGHVGNTPRQEAQASEWAVTLLISGDEFKRAWDVFGSHVAVAHELAVLPEDVETYCRLLARAGGDGVTFRGIEYRCNHK